MEIVRTVKEHKRGNFCNKICADVLKRVACAKT